MVRTSKAKGEMAIFDDGKVDCIPVQAKVGGFVVSRTRKRRIAQSVACASG